MQKAASVAESRCQTIRLTRKKRNANAVSRIEGKYVFQKTQNRMFWAPVPESIVHEQRDPGFSENEVKFSNGHVADAML
jgi:hypothetical protein